MSETINGIIKDADQALTLIERVVVAPLPVILVIIICVLLYALYHREKKNISVNKKLGRAKSILTGLIAQDENISVIEAEKLVFNLLEKKQY